MVEMDRKPGADNLDYAPADGSVVTSNPPTFVWIPIPGAVSYTLEYSTDPSFAVAATNRVTDIDISIYTPVDAFDPDRTWYWRVWATNISGARSSPTRTRSFRVSPTATMLGLPPMTQLRAQIPQGHPRLFITPESLPEWRKNLESSVLLRVLWKDIYYKEIERKPTPLEVG